MLCRKPLLLFAALLCTGSVWAQNSASVRLGFLGNFARYVDWPETALRPGMPLRLCLAPGDADMAAQLGDLSSQAVNGRPVQARQVVRPADASGCHLVFLPAETPGSLAAWLAAAKQTGALTVGDLPDFVDAGGMIGLVSVGGRYRFDLNLGVARQAELRFSSQMLKLARTVK